jgi:hypothetical protein
VKVIKPTRLLAGDSRLAMPATRDLDALVITPTRDVDEMHGEFQRAEHEVKVRAIDAAAQLMAGRNATVAAGRQMVRLGDAESQRAAEATVRRSARRAHGLLTDRL